MKVDVVQVGPLQVNCYIISCPKTKHTVAIDPGGDAALILNRIKNFSGELKAVFLTHGHFDHIYAVRELQVMGAKVYASQNALPAIKRGPDHAMMFGLHEPELFDVDEYIQENQMITIGELEFTVIETPGHSSGGVCYKCGDHVFSGDTLFFGSIGRTDLPGGNHQQLLDSIRQKLLVLDDETNVYPGHGPATTISFEKLNNPFLL